MLIGEEIHTARFAIVTNGQYYGGDYRVSGPGLLTSGEFETILVKRVSDLLRPDVFAGIMTRRPLNRAMVSLTSTEVHARSPGSEVPVQLDGELWGRLPMSFRIEPGALNVVCYRSRVRLVDDEHGRAPHVAAAQGCQRLVGLLQGEGHDLRSNRHLGGEGEEVQAVLAREVGHRAHRALVPQDLVWGRRGCRSCVCPRRPRSRPWRRALRAAGTRAPTGAKMIAASSSSGGASSELPAQSAPSSLANSCASSSSGSGEGEDAPSLVRRDLGHDVGRGPEAVETEPLGVAGEAQASGSPIRPAHRQGRGLQAGETLGDRETETSVGDGVLGVAAVDLVPGEPGVLAEVLAPGETVAALAVGPPQPRHPDPLPYREAVCALADLLHRTDYLVAWDQGQAGSGNSPSTTCRSVLHTAQQCTRKRTCPSPGSGVATSATLNGSPGTSRIIARTDVSSYSRSRNGVREHAPYSTVTLLARLRGLSTSRPRSLATWYARSCSGTLQMKGARISGASGTGSTRRAILCAPFVPLTGDGDHACAPGDGLLDVGEGLLADKTLSEYGYDGTMFVHECDGTMLHLARRIAL